MLHKCYWIVLYIVHVTAFCLGGPFFSGHGVLQIYRGVLMTQSAYHEKSINMLVWNGQMAADLLNWTMMTISLSRVSETSRDPGSHMPLKEANWGYSLTSASPWF